MNKEIRQVDLARKLGVSQRTVSYALSADSKQYSLLSAPVRERVRKAAREYGYRPHRMAQLMRGVKSGVIGIIGGAPGIETAIARQRFAAKAIRGGGFELFVSSLWEGEEELGRAVDAMIEARVEGIVLIGLVLIGNGATGHTIEQLNRIVSADIPMVSIGDGLSSLVPSVMSYYKQGFAILTEHALSLGHRRLAYLTLWSSEQIATVPGIEERVAGFTETAARAGISPSNATIVHETSPHAYMDGYYPGKLGMKKIFRMRKRPSVVLCSNDVMAFGAMAACAEAGVRVPDDIAITGFDNNSFGQYTTPPLTTVAQPSEAVGRKAVEMLIGLIRREGSVALPKMTRLPCQLVARQSCGEGLRKSAPAGGS